MDIIQSHTYLINLLKSNTYNIVLHVGDLIHTTSETIHLVYQPASVMQHPHSRDNERHTLLSTTISYIYIDTSQHSGQCTVMPIILYT